MKDNWQIYCALKSIKRHQLNKNYGLMVAELDNLGMELANELEVCKDLGWLQ